MSTTPWSARRDVEHRSRSSPRSSDAFRSPRWMIVLGTRPIQNSFVAGARGDVVGIRAAAVSAKRCLYSGSREAAESTACTSPRCGGGPVPDPCGSERGSVRGILSTRISERRFASAGGNRRTVPHGTRSQGRILLARDRKAANCGRRLSRAGREILVFNASATASGQTRSEANPRRRRHQIRRVSQSLA